MEAIRLSPSFTKFGTVTRFLASDTSSDILLEVGRKGLEAEGEGPPWNSRTKEFCTAKWYVRAHIQTS